MLGLVQPERTVAPHKIVHIHDPPLPKSILPQPLHQSFQFVPRFQKRRRNHLIFHNNQMFVSIQLVRNGYLRHNQPQWTFDQNQHPQNHFLVPIVYIFVCCWVVEFLVVLGEIKRGISDQPKLFILCIFMVFLRMLIFLPPG